LKPALDALRAILAHTRLPRIYPMKEKQITTTQLRRTPGRLMDEARHTPLVITRFGRRSSVLLSYELYAALTAGRIVGRFDEADSRMVEAVLETEMDARHSHLDSLMSER
jgi:prevent-host-death family protein